MWISSETLANVWTVVAILFILFDKSWLESRSLSKSIDWSQGIWIKRTDLIGVIYISVTFIYQWHKIRLFSPMIQLFNQLFKHIKHVVDTLRRIWKRWELFVFLRLFEIFRQWYNLMLYFPSLIAYSMYFNTNCLFLDIVGPLTHQVLQTNWIPGDDENSVKDLSFFGRARLVKKYEWLKINSFIDFWPVSWSLGSHY